MTLLLAQLAVAAAVLTGTAPSGATYTFSHRVQAHRTCERLRLVSADGGESGARNCQPAHARRAHGQWVLDCRSHDFSVFGSVYARGTRVVLRTDAGEEVAARRVVDRRRRMFLLVADGAALPGRVEIRAPDGTVRRTLRFDSAEELCSGSPAPLEVTYVF